ncbi:MAG: HAD family hydrolase [Planctomycetes bacterium]|nr:HAD family hydrolase [Planctomycetota bacterium]
MASLHGILFDLGDTLLDFGPVNTLKLFEQGARLTYAYLQALQLPVPTFRSYHRRQLRAIRWAYFKSRLIRRDFDCLDIIRPLARSMGHDLTPEQFQELAWRWYQPLSQQASIEPTLPEILQQLADRDLKLGVVSNTFIPGAVLDRHLDSIGLLRLFVSRTYSCDIRYRKPHPNIFRHALNKTGLLAEHTIFVGDSPKADIYGAKQVGMIAVLKDPIGRRKAYRIPPDYTIFSLKELPKIVEQYLGVHGASDTKGQYP